MRNALLLALLGSVSISAQQLPPGPGADVLKSRCVICHEADIITSQKLSLTGWTNSINKMVRWGSQITAEEREVLQRDWLGLGRQVVDRDFVGEVDDEKSKEAPRWRQAEDLAQELRGLLLVVAPHDRVIELGRHAALSPETCRGGSGS